jgi:hypothetical protein
LIWYCVNTECYGILSLVCNNQSSDMLLIFQSGSEYYLWLIYFWFMTNYNRCFYRISYVLFCFHYMLFFQIWTIFYKWCLHNFQLQLIFKCLETILLRIADDLGQFYKSGQNIVKKLLAGHVLSIFNTLNIKNKYENFNFNTCHAI